MLSPQVTEPTEKEILWHFEFSLLSLPLPQYEKYISAIALHIRLGNSANVTRTIFQ